MLLLVAQHAAALYALEQAASAVSAAPLRAAVAELLRFLTRRWIVLFGSTSARANPIGLARFVGEVRAEVHAIQPDVAAPLTRYAVQARKLGAEQAAREVLLLDEDFDDDDEPHAPRQERRPAEDRTVVIEPDRARADENPPPADGTADENRRRADEDLSDEVWEVLVALDDKVTKHLLDVDKALDGLDDNATYGDALTAAAHANRAATTAEQTTSWVVNRSANDGVQDVADELGLERIWVAERDACVHCQGLAGATSVDGVFDASLTFAEKPLAVWPGPDLTSPPRHPNCRCRTQPWIDAEMPAGVPDQRDALKREAERSILTGWRLPSESERVRLGAAERLLAAGTKLPASVQARARTAVRRGEFATFPRIKTGRTR
jgi:hypothetical protein